MYSTTTHFEEDNPKEKKKEALKSSMQSTQISSNMKKKKKKVYQSAKCLRIGRYKCILIMERTDNKQCYTSFKSPFFGLMNQPLHTFPSQLHLHAWHAKFLHKIVMWAGSEALPKHLACSRELGMH